MTKTAISMQLEPSLFPDLCPIAAAVNVLADAGIEARGAVFTRREVVEFILDLVGYTPSLPLHRHRLLEPSFGGGDFLLPVVSRLLKAWRATARAMLSKNSAIACVPLSFTGPASRRLRKHC